MITKATDLIYAFRIITLLSTPWEKQAAYEHGIIDSTGKQLKKFKDLTTSSERAAYTYLHRIVFNLKRLLQTVPGGKSWVGSATASYLLLRENLKELDIDEKTWSLVEEAIFNMDEDVPTNSTGASVSTNVEKPIGRVLKRKRNVKK